MDNIYDKDIIPLVEKSVDKNHPRDWYYALLDYGVYIKLTYGNPNTHSKYYRIQTPYKDSDRYIRARILEAALGGKKATFRTLARNLKIPLKRVRAIGEKLAGEGMVRVVRDRIEAV